MSPLPDHSRSLFPHPLFLVGCSPSCLQDVVWGGTGVPGDPRWNPGSNGLFLVAPSPSSLVTQPHQGVVEMNQTDTDAENNNSSSSSSEQQQQQQLQQQQPQQQQQQQLLVVLGDTDGGGGEDGELSASSVHSQEQEEGESSENKIK
ncbi:hypothetical protein Pmani_012564 [Petrolisthes manimaculis]|uniref:Uncharacterized protein n=1 Tax=Petrolisthes manimaculis TaxID=1843537 RepID=A0AAE1PYC4_9EUCA|nr:hypothetical protein Pmani_012564 [Petrolisthes manimaculis]